MNLQTVPVSKLIASPLNVRKTLTDVSDLVENIGNTKRIIQNLSVVSAPKGKFQVVAGGRRLQALQILVEQGRIDKDFLVPVSIVEIEQATQVSLTENFHRLNMEPVEEFLAFKKLLDEGASAEVIASSHNVTPAYVTRRMKVANLAPAILQAFVDEEIDLDDAMAYATTDDHEIQLEVFEKMGSNSPSYIKSAILNLTSEICTTNRLVQFVGIDAYKNAGGSVRQDLFSDVDEGFINDGALLHRLVGEKLETEIERIKAEGFNWVDGGLAITRQELYTDYQAIHATNGDLSKADLAKRTALEKRIEKLEAKIEAIDEDSEDGYEQQEALEAEANTHQEAIDEIEAKYAQYPESSKPFIGAVVFIDSKGGLEVNKGYVRKADIAKIKPAKGELDLTVGENTAPKNPASLVRTLTANRTIALQAHLASDPRKALVVLTARLVSSLQHQYDLTSVKITPTFSHAHLICLDETIEKSIGGKKLETLAKEWKSVFKAKDTIKAVDSLTDEELYALLGLLSASTLDTVTEQANTVAEYQAIGSYVGLDINEYWKPTASNYFSKLGKAYLIELITAKAPEKAQGAEKLKKADLALLAEKVYEGSGWTPDLMKAKK